MPSLTKEVTYQAINQPVLSLIPGFAKRVIDLGCGSGALGKQIKQTIDCEVVGITHSEGEAELAAACLDKVLLCDLNDLDPQSLGQFDCIVCSHVLEHLYHPQALLSRLRDNLHPDGLLIVALPNTLHWKQRVEFLRGRFQYTDGGLMDRTHYRFFDWNTSSELVEGAGFRIVKRLSDGNFPLPLIRAIARPIANHIDEHATKFMPGLFGVQFIIVARKTGV